jgi:hypothetical protein
MIWHYTVDECFVSIMENELIRPATAYVPAGEKPIVWFSTEDFWEPTVTKGFLRADGTIENVRMSGLLERGHLLFRLGVDSSVAPYKWSDLRSLSGMSDEIARGLASAARAAGGNPSRWRGTFDAVPMESWETIERFNGIEWVELDLSE